MIVVIGAHWKEAFAFFLKKKKTSILDWGGLTTPLRYFEVVSLTLHLRGYASCFFPEFGPR